MSEDKESRAISITGCWLRAFTDRTGKETISVELEVDGSWHTVIRETGGQVAQQDNGANISHCVEPSGIRKVMEGVEIKP